MIKIYIILYFMYAFIITYILIKYCSKECRLAVFSMHKKSYRKKKATVDIKCDFFNIYNT